MSKFTPGPWNQCKDGLGPMSVYGPDNKGIWHKDRADDETEANAALIAAAPEMYEALNEAWQWFEDNGRGDNETSRQIKAAISKAEGGK